MVQYKFKFVLGFKKVLLIKRKQIKEYSVHVMEAARTIGAALGYPK